MRVICFGDSNTFGFDPRSYLGGRYDAASRWVDIIAEKTGWEIRNNSMCGREIPRKEVAFSQSFDLIILMLGTNDLLQGNSVAEISARMEHFLLTLSINRKKILLIAPPSLTLGEWVQNQDMVDSSAALADAYRAISERLGTQFVDAGKWKIPLAFDGVHLTEEGNKTFAEELYHYLTQEFFLC